MFPKNRNTNFGLSFVWFLNRLLGQNSDKGTKMREYFSKYPLEVDPRYEVSTVSMLHVKIHELISDLYTKSPSDIYPVKLSKDLFELRQRNLFEFDKRNFHTDWLRHQYECDDTLSNYTIRVVPKSQYSYPATLQLLVKEVECNSIMQGDPYPQTSMDEMYHVNKIQNEKTNIDSGIYNRETVFHIQNPPEYRWGAVEGSIEFKKESYWFKIASAFGLDYRDYNTYWVHDNIDDIVIHPHQKTITVKWKTPVEHNPHYMSVTYEYLDWQNFTKHEAFHWYK